MGSSAAESTGRHWHALCLVVPPSAASASAESRASVEQLIASLSRRGLTIRRCADGFDAMAEIVQHERQRRFGKTRDPIVVVLIEPARQPRAEALMNSALRHGSTAVFWEFQGGPSARLVAYRPQRTPAPPEPVLNLTLPPTPIVARGVSVATEAERPPLRLTPEPALRIAQDDSEDDVIDPISPRAPVGPAVLTDEELSMLLGEGPDGSLPGGARA